MPIAGRLSLGRRPRVPERPPRGAAPGLSGVPVPAALDGMRITILENIRYKPMTKGVERRYRDADQA